MQLVNVMSVLEQAASALVTDLTNEVSNRAVEQSSDLVRKMVRTELDEFDLESRSEEALKEAVNNMDLEDLIERNVSLEELVENKVDIESLVQHAVDDVDWSDLVNENLDYDDIAERVKAEVEESLLNATKEAVNSRRMEDQISDSERHVGEQIDYLNSLLGKTMERLSELQERIVSVENQLLLASKQNPDLRAQFLTLAAIINAAFREAA